MSLSAAIEKRPAACRVLTLRLGKELYGLDVMNVREIIRPLEIAPVPRAPREFLGVINLRGKIVPVIDLRIKFCLAATSAERACIVVVQTQTQARAPKLAGLLVDEVQEVMSLPASEIDDAPVFGSAAETTFIRGLARTKGAVTILLDLERLLGGTKTELAL